MSERIWFGPEKTSSPSQYQIGRSEGLDGFTDSDWGNSITRRSTASLVARYNSGVIMWRSKMKKTVSQSTAEAEYCSASEMAIEVSVVPP